MKKLLLLSCLMMSVMTASAQYYDFQLGGSENQRRVFLPPDYDFANILYKEWDTIRIEFLVDTTDFSKSNVKFKGTAGQYMNGKGVPTTFPTIPTNTNQLTNGSGFLTSEVDASVTNEIQTLSISTNTITLSNGGGSVTLPSTSTPGTDNVSAYSAGTAYSLTSSSAKVDLSTTDPVITLPSAGTYILMANLKLDYAGLTTVGESTASFKLRRTNNTAADISNATAIFTAPIVTLLTGPAGDTDIKTVIYTTSTSGDVIEMWGVKGANISVGNLNVSEAWILAVKIY